MLHFYVVVQFAKVFVIPFLLVSLKVYHDEIGHAIAEVSFNGKTSTSKNIENSLANYPKHPPSISQAFPYYKKVFTHRPAR